MPRIFTIPPLILRGMGSMPHVGSHPGNGLMLVLLVMGFAAGAQTGGWKEGIYGGIAFFMGMFPFYAWGAYDRARISDTDERRAELKTLFSAWLISLPEPPKRPVNITVLYWSRDRRVSIEAELTQGRVEKVSDAPDWLDEAVLKILTRPIVGFAPPHLKWRDVSSFRIEHSQPSAHARMEALRIVREAGAAV